MIDVYIYRYPLPSKVKGVLLERDDYIVFVNEYLSETEQAKAIKHELKHIEYGHIYDLRNVGAVEREVG